MFTFLDLQNEVKRRSTKDQGGTTFDTAIKNIINTSVFRLARECPWRVLRRKSFFNTETSYSTGTGAVSVTSGSASFSVTGATFLTDGIHVGRRVKFGTDSNYYTIRTITSETGGTIDRNYDGTTSTSTSYEILPREEYNLPIQVNPQRDFLWHNAYGTPTMLEYVTEQDFRSYNVNDIQKGIPVVYRMWGQDMVIKQPTQASVVRISSTLSADTSVPITVFGVVSGYPDFEVISTNASNGTTPNSGTKSFSSIERVAKGSPSVGRIVIDTNSSADIVAIIPVGDSTAGIVYAKCQLWPLPDTVFPVNVLSYKDPWRLVNDNDVHELGQEFDEAIILLGTSKIKYETSMNDDGDKFFGLYNDEVRSLRRTNMDKIDWLPTLKKPSNSRFNNNRIGSRGGLLYSQLGPNYGPSGYR
jgi:hypothetical protein